jgi:Zn-dependent protease
MTTSDINVVLALMIIVSFLVAIILHECGHALVASWLGDPTPSREGRLSFNLLAHLDPVGTLLAVILAFLPVGAGPVGLGWGKPVKSDPWKLRGGPNMGTLFVALGGIVTSLLVGLVFAVVLRFVTPIMPDNAIAFRLPQLIAVFASVNISLAIFNIIPLYPLDGYQILYTLLPSRQAVQFAKSAPYGPFIILALLFLLPFLGQLSGLGNFFLFHIPYYILLGSFNIIGPVSGLSVNFITALYVF